MLGFFLLNPLRVHCWGWLQWLMAWWLQHPLFTEMAGGFPCPKSDVRTVSPCITVTGLLLSPEFICYRLNPLYLRTWCYLKIGLLQMLLLKIIIRVGPNPRWLVSLYKVEVWTKTHQQEEGHVEMKAEIGTMLLQTKEHQRLLELVEPHETNASSQPSERCSPSDILILAF